MMLIAMKMKMLYLYPLEVSQNVIKAAVFILNFLQFVV